MGSGTFKKLIAMLNLVKLFYGFMAHYLNVLLFGRNVKRRGNNDSNLGY